MFTSPFLGYVRVRISSAVALNFKRLLRLYRDWRLFELRTCRRDLRPVSWCVGLATFSICFFHTMISNSCTKKNRITPPLSTTSIVKKIFAPLCNKNAQREWRPRFETGAPQPATDLARLDALAPAAGAGAARDANSNEQSYWNSMLPAVPERSDGRRKWTASADGVRPRACAASRSATSASVRRSRKCKRNGGNLLTERRRVRGNATVADLGQRYAQARAAGGRPRACRRERGRAGGGGVRRV